MYAARAAPRDRPLASQVTPTGLELCPMRQRGGNRARCGADRPLPLLLQPAGGRAIRHRREANSGSVGHRTRRSSCAAWLMLRSKLAEQRERVPGNGLRDHASKIGQDVPGASSRRWPHGGMTCRGRMHAACVVLGAGPCHVSARAALTRRADPLHSAGPEARLRHRLRRRRQQGTQADAQLDGQRLALRRRPRA